MGFGGIERFVSGNSYIAYWHAGTPPLSLSLSLSSIRAWQQANESQTGSMVISYITTPITTWITLLILLSVHLALNYKAVRAVQMTTLNRQRANIVFSGILGSDPDVLFLLHNFRNGEEEKGQLQEKQWEILTPAQTSIKEDILEPDGLVKWHTSTTSDTLGTARIGISMHEYLSLLCHPADVTQFPALTVIFSKEAYILTVTRQRTSSLAKNFITPAGVERRERLWQAGILLKTGNQGGSASGSSSRVQLKAWLHAVLVMRVLSSGTGTGTSTGKKEEGDILQVLEKTLRFLNQRMEGYLHALQTGGWEVDHAVLETNGSTRVLITS